MGQIEGHQQGLEKVTHLSKQLLTAVVQSIGALELKDGQMERFLRTAGIQGLKVNNEGGGCIAWARLCIDNGPGQVQKQEH